MSRIPVEEALDTYNIALWGGGYFSINNEGELTVRPTRDPEREVALPKLVAEMRRRGLETPLLFRFPQIVANRVAELVGAFRGAMAEFGYEGAEYLPAFPMKVNQQREVVDALIQAGRDFKMGLEAGSRAELMAALALDVSPGALTVVNGYKDLETMRLAILGARCGRRVVIVIEKQFEIEPLLRAFEEAGPGPLPEVGFRVRLFARGAGKWWKSSGVTAKFGLTTEGLLEVVRRLADAGHLDRASMVHFHIGSQIPEIRRFKTAFREAARFYAKLRRLNVPVSILDVGGGLAVDYDGSKTASDASMNYSIAEYANDVVYAVKEVCAEEKVPLPSLVSESGRALVAYHSLLVANVLGRITSDAAPERLEASLNEPRVVSELRSIVRDINAKNYLEYYHDAGELREEMSTLFAIGMISLADRSMTEGLYWEIARRALAFARREKVPLEEFEELERALHEKYVVNFSVFQSTPDHWALDQLFPIVPIQRLREAPDHQATLVDITCDSDGEIDKFIDIKDIKETLPLHAIEAHQEEPYDIAFTLLGAYQDVMGDMHNLFGMPDEVLVTVGDDGEARVEKVVRGDTVTDVLRIFGYPHEELLGSVRAALMRRVALDELSEDEAERLLASYGALFTRGTYLSRLG